MATAKGKAQAYAMTAAKLADYRAAKPLRRVLDSLSDKELLAVHKKSLDALRKRSVCEKCESKYPGLRCHCENDE